MLLFAGTSGIQEGEPEEHKNPSLASTLPPLRHDWHQWDGQLNTFAALPYAEHTKAAKG